MPNEDCLYVFDDGVRAVHIVADGHHGHEASHDLVEALCAAYDEMGPELDPEEALELVQRFLPAGVVVGDEGSDDRLCPASRTTLIIACLDRRERTLRGISIGDSTVFVGSLESGVQRAVAPSDQYAAPWERRTMSVQMAQSFAVPVSPGDWVISCTDGVTECCYGKPEMSIQAEDLETLMIKAAGVPDHFVEAVTELALNGVAGHPGGEDNIAIITSTV